MVGPTRGCSHLMILDVRWASTRVILTSIILAIFIFCEMLPYTHKLVFTQIALATQQVQSAVTA
jgi:hypothetical protein